ncbi:hypothetical protein GCM10011376_24140 [Nocardioides flavus (ex Wang et al. 2016)]|uniref:Uncharacterized protein n=1 Tax=Nocardioides flavus (ex Wang et al. 2016) TaxID=2058780 RepID=A0ABQ3HNS1_9ACTN|nr:hypothetical protein [Nocardioides flavus (ex Wang et al. 2016)]GHE17804.1 hypothetical protein GCM10011376_24140 [Nocardioides flavus (ex Wang et al. 2016)]
MTMPHMTTPARDRLVSGALLVLALPLVAAATFMGLVWLGPLGVVITPAAVVAAVMLYWLTVRSTHSSTTRAVVREVGAAALAVASGFAARVACYVLGVLAGVMPFITYREEGYPLMEEWKAGSLLVAIATVPLMFLLLRRWADDRSAG